MNDRIYRIYLYTNLITNKPCYVGQTSTPLKKRAYSKGTGYKHQPFFWNEIQKYGWKNFQVEILTTTSDKEYANLLEWFYTIEFNTQYPNGCNDSIGWKRSDRYKKLYSGRKNSNYGKHPTEETRKAMSEKAKNREPWTKEQRERQRARVSSLRWFTNGTINVRKKECPENYWPGCTRFN